MGTSKDIQQAFLQEKDDVETVEVQKVSASQNPPDPVVKAKDGYSVLHAGSTSNKYGYNSTGEAKSSCVICKPSNEKYVTKVLCVKQQGPQCVIPKYNDDKDNQCTFNQCP